MVEAAEQLLQLKPHQVHRTGFRLDGGFGSDANINWFLPRGFQGLIKGYNPTRATASARRIASEAWQAQRADRWVAVVPDGHRYDRLTQSLLVRWLNQEPDPKLRYALLIHTLLDWNPLQIVEHYDARGQMEVEIEQDKLGLQLTRRRKRHWEAQEAWVILTDRLHTLLSWTRDWMGAGSRFQGYGALRVTRDLLTVPGSLEFKGTNSKR